MNNEIGIPGSVEDAVVRYAKLAQQAGDGVVASSLEVEAITSVCGQAFKTVIPGIRPAGADIGDQARVLTPGKPSARAVTIWLSAARLRNPRTRDKQREQIIEEMIQA